MAKTLLIPEAIDVGSEHPRAKLYAYCNSVMEPWDGPAAIAAFAGDWVVGGLDRNGLRPMRYVVTHDGLVIAGSETGMVVVPDHNIAERGGLGPGEMIGINLNEGRLYKDAELKTVLSKKRNWNKWVSRAKQMDALLASSAGKASARSTLFSNPPSSNDGWLDIWKIWNLCCNQWPRQAKKPLGQWAMIRRLRS